MKLLGKYVFAVVLCMAFQIQASEQAQISVVDPMPFHIHSEQTNISMLLSRSKILPVYYQWRDYLGNAITEPKPLTALINTTKIPSKEPGYYGLVFMAADDVILNDRRSGEELEFGFGMIDPTQVVVRNVNKAERFGTVHTNRNDPYMPTWIKTMTWKTATSQDWKKENSNRNDQDFLELPIIVEDEWESDDNVPISMEQLAKLKAKVSQYIQADQQVKYWELGIEENLLDRFQQKYYWQNLAKKVAVVRQAADQANPENIKLIFQIAELDLKPVRLFLNSEAARSFDILSLHPYNWPDFPAAETWVAQYLEKVRTEMKKAEQHFPVWFTEVGAPHHGNHPDHFFGYPEEGIKVQGLSRSRSVSYMIKLHVVAFYENVEKVFWYNYFDQESDRKYAENHFGMVDYYGYPKPVYLAYTHLYSSLKGKQATGVKTIGEDVLVYTFEDQKEKTLVIWSRSVGERKVSVKEFNFDLAKMKITNAVGKLEAVSDGFIAVSEMPIFIINQK